MSLKNLFFLLLLIFFLFIFSVFLFPAIGFVSQFVISSLIKEKYMRRIVKSLVALGMFQDG